MCGIFGYIGKTNFLNTKKKILLIKKLIEYRGSDSYGYLYKKINNNNLCFLHSRLSIIDPSPRSNQPFSDDEGIISFNGMIYNYKSIRDDLQKIGVVFKTNSDTEVLLKFLNKYGIKNLSKLDGMWAFSYYNFKKKKMYLSRDRFAEKPLFIYTTKNDVIYGSNIDYILNSVNYKFKIKKKIIENFLKYGFKSLFMSQSGDTFFKKIRFVAPGTYLEIDENLLIKTKNFWQPLKIIINKNLSYKSEKNKLFKTYNNLIKERTVSDFPIACLLSGGIDSASIASLSSKVLMNKDFHCFSVLQKDKRYDESSLIKKNIKKNNLKHTFLGVTKSNKKNLNIIGDILNTTGSFVPTTTSLTLAHLCNKIKKKNYKVILSGIGGDEFFSGYFIHHLYYLKSIQLKNKKLFNKAFDEWSKNVAKFIRSGFLKDYKLYLSLEKKIDLTHFETQNLKVYFKNYNPKIHQPKKFYQDFFKNKLYNDIIYNSLPVQTNVADTISMYYGLESRSPFLSEKLYNSSFSYPNNFLIRNGYAKKILRDSLTGSVSSSVLNNREKIGFYMDIDSFFNFKDKKLIDFMFSNNYLNSLLDLKIIKRHITNKKKDNQFTNLLIGIINCVFFFKKYKKNI